MPRFGRRPFLLIAAALFGLSLRIIVTRSVAPSMLDTDGMQGLWVGACLGLGLLGLGMLLSARRGGPGALAP